MDKMLTEINKLVSLLCILLRYNGHMTILIKTILVMTLLITLINAALHIFTVISKAVYK
jgi:hypothetical protein